MSEREAVTTCFHYTHLSDADVAALREGRPVFCGLCRALLWIKDGKLEIREAHATPSVPK